MKERLATLLKNINIYCGKCHGLADDGLLTCKDCPTLQDLYNTSEAILADGWVQIQDFAEIIDETTYCALSPHPDESPEFSKDRFEQLVSSTISKRSL